MAGILKKIEESGIDRRRFIGLAATAGAVASLGLSGCSNKVVETTEESPTVDKLTGGEWITFCCPATSCCQRCHNQAYVVDGVILQQKSDDRHPDSADYQQYRGCLKGRSQRWNITSADRLKYPMKRKNWQPGGGENTNGHLRGVDEWERISWDEAIQYIADELVRIRDTYGNRAFLTTGVSERYVSDMQVGSPILNLLGGCLTTWGVTSNGGQPVVNIHMRGSWSYGYAESQDNMAMRHTKLMVLFGFNPAWSTSGGEMWTFLNTKRISGCKVIVIDPYFNPSMQVLADQWIPVHPGTDGALVEALAYEMIENDWQDQDFLDRCTVGFDADHMPEDAKTNENFKDHILGQYDGQPKTPEWASVICGIDPDVIRGLAKDIATIKPATLKTTGATARTYYGNRFSQLFLAFGWMTGNVGKAGAEVTLKATPTLGRKNMLNNVALGSAGTSWPPNPMCTGGRSDIQKGDYDPEKEYGITLAEIFKAVVTGEYHLPGPEGKTRECDIKCIYRDNQNAAAVTNIGAKWVEEAFRKVEFVMIQDPWLVTDAQYADIVLPIQTSMEHELSTSQNLVTQNDFTLVGSRVINPYYEAKTDAEVYYLLADKLGFGDDLLPRISDDQGVFNRIVGATVANKDGATRDVLVTITQADLEQWGVDGTPQEGLIPLGEFLENGYQVERHEDDNLMVVFDKEFVNDPEANPVGTPSGKYEIYCQSLKDHYDFASFNDIDALPKYKPDTVNTEIFNDSSDFNFQLITMSHIRQVHTAYSTSRVINEVFPNDLLMSTYDAEKYGYEKGGWVTVRSAEGGKIARRLNVIPNLMPGVVALGHGNWKNVDPESGIDIGGCTNTVTPSRLAGDGYQAYNAVPVAIEPYDGTQLLPDFQRPRLAPIA
jgi:anaerobic dimethyl sulfoxide reductase subunit A